MAPGLNTGSIAIFLSTMGRGRWTTALHGRSAAEIPPPSGPRPDSLDRRQYAAELHSESSWLRPTASPWPRAPLGLAAYGAHGVQKVLEICKPNVQAVSATGAMIGQEDASDSVFQHRRASFPCDAFDEQGNLHHRRSRRAASSYRAASGTRYGLPRGRAPRW